jgi:hypothetical protein
LLAINRHFDSLSVREDRTLLNCGSGIDKLEREGLWSRTPRYQSNCENTCTYGFKMVFHFNLQLDCLILFHLPALRQQQVLDALFPLSQVF